MSRYQVSTQAGNHIEVDGGNWLVALGLGLDVLGVVANIDRLACEVLLNGTVIVRDVRAGQSFVVQALSDDDTDAPFMELEDDEPSDEHIEVAEEDSSDDSDADGPDDGITDLSGLLMPISADEELALFSIDSDGRGESVHFTAPYKERVALPVHEELALPEEDFEELDPRIEALVVLLEESTTTFDAWKLALEGACRVIGAESGAALCREEDGALRFLFAVGPRSHEVLGRRLPPGRGIAGFCAQRDVGLLITEPNRDSRFFSRMDQTTGYTTRTILAVPVSTEDAVLGCIELLNAPNGFTSEQLDHLSILAGGLADRLDLEGH